MGRQIHRLTESMVKNAKPKETVIPVSDRVLRAVRQHPGFSRAEKMLHGAVQVVRDGKPAIVRCKHTMLADGLGLWLQVGRGEDGTIRRSWIYRYSVPEKVVSKNGKQRQRQRQMGLGSVNTMSLADARAKAVELRKMRLEGIDPIEARHGQKIEAALAAAKAMTFDEAARAFMADRSGSWKSAKHAMQWRQSLEDYVSPIIGSLPVASIDSELVIKVLSPIWKQRPVTAGRVRGRIEQILDYARIHGKRPAEEANPARWRGHLAHVFDPRTNIAPVKHVAALPFKEVPSFMAELAKIDGTAARALEWTVLTAVRTGSVLQAEWGEIDESARVWTVPPSHTKRNRVLRVPLPDLAITVLASLDRSSPRLFQIAVNSMLQVCKRINPNISVHGFRSAFSDWAAETTDFAHELIEESLAHQVGNQVVRAYRRMDLLPKRRPLMDSWAAFCSGVEMRGSNVIALRK